MARPSKKRGFRPIVVDGFRYSWRLDDDNRVADLEVYLETEQSRHGQRLCVDTKVHWPSRVTGRIVSQIIREAVRLGWNPHEVGKDFSLEMLAKCDGIEVQLTNRSN